MIPVQLGGRWPSQAGRGVIWSRRYRWGASAVVAEPCDGPVQDWEWPLWQRGSLHIAAHDALWLAL